MLTCHAFITSQIVFSICTVLSCPLFSESCPSCPILLNLKRILKHRFFFEKVRFSPVNKLFINGLPRYSSSWPQQDEPRWFGIKNQKLNSTFHVIYISTVSVRTKLYPYRLIKLDKALSPCTDLICPLSAQPHYRSCTLLPTATTHPGSIACLSLFLARPPRLPVAGAHVTPPEGGRRLAVTVAC
jgi:hypothetical protein